MVASAFLHIRYYHDKLLLWNTNDVATCGTQLDVLAIRPNSSKIHKQQHLYSSPEISKNPRTWVGIEPTTSHGLDSHSSPGISFPEKKSQGLNTSATAFVYECYACCLVQKFRRIPHSFLFVINKHNIMICKCNSLLEIIAILYIQQYFPNTHTHTHI